MRFVERAENGNTRGKWIILYIKHVAIFRSKLYSDNLPLLCLYHNIKKKYVFYRNG